ncbi:putative feruloyl esterase B precursor [Massarina eburnea CBS 473.64]|uniref:Carboxylic ester hydrolase n=1 Tax=Massarina eburnea CBS 473.64 TaxID=1395130 RepID=A0A6A6RVY0_9PLEO|nr:putative feruloyl esterase B precursor [Massarina eburnea CBS 473.64]
MKLFFLNVLAILLRYTNASASFQSRCLAFSPESTIFNSTLTAREYVTKGTNLTFPDNDKSCNQPFQVAAANLCRIALHVPTSNRSSITMELWLPEQWESGRVLAAGNGGIDGCIAYDDLAYGTEHGFATVAANNGHNGTSGKAFLNNPDVIIDYAYRSLHTSILQAKKLASLFYGQKYQKSYYIGCSLGGRQGIGAADRYPDDFDGIVAGSPASDFNHLYAWRASFYPITGKNTSADFINAAKWVVIHDEVLRQCDTLDGVKDGIIEDPSLCHFRPEALLCQSGQNTSQCLSSAQVEILNRIYNSPLYGTDGKLIYPAMQPGNELKASTGLYNGLAWPLSQDWYRYVLLNDSTWDASTFNISTAMLADQINPSNIRTFPTTLAPFASVGGKLITFHGGQDQQITSFQGARFYNNLARGMSVSSASLDEFYRFFRISGMFHCGSGPGAWVFGQAGAASAAGIPFEAENNVLAAIVDWVEKGKAPEGILGTKFVDDTVAKGVSFQRRHCRYPFRNTYVSGDAKEPGNWQCRGV